MEKGDKLANLMFSIGRVGGKPAYVDNVRLSDYPIEKLARVSTGIPPARKRAPSPSAAVAN
jgi:hypothetical protein